MSRFYTWYESDTVVNIFEFNPSGHTRLSFYDGPSAKEPLIQMKDRLLEARGYTRLAALSLTASKTEEDGLPVCRIGCNKEGLQLYESVDWDWSVDLSYSLVLNGKIDIRHTNGFAHNNYKHARSLIGKREDGTVLLCVADGRNMKSRGVDTQKSAEIMLALGCENAINAGGGGPSQLLYNNRVINDYPGLFARPIKQALLVYEKEPTKEDHPTDYPTLKLWAKGDYVAILQQALYAHGHSTGRVDGVFGWAVLSAIKAFQQENQMTPSGDVDGSLWSLLLKTQTKKE